jgi:hypothetical protein
MVSREDIIKPLLFLDIFDYPPTALEIWRFLPMPAELGEVIEKVPSREGWTAASAGRGVLSMGEQSMINKQLAVTHPASQGSAPLSRGESNGFYFLPGREELIEKRREFDYLSEKKFKIARHAARLLHFIPSIKMIAVCNNFYYRPESDIDFFIIARNGRLWLTRFFATIILDLFRLRARGKKTADKICLSFYLSEADMDLKKIALLEELDPSRGASAFAKASADKQNDKKIDDPYLAYWLAFLEPIYGQRCYNKFWEANSWIKNIFPNVLPKEPVSRRMVGYVSGLKTVTHPVASGTRHPSREGNNFFGDWLEKAVKKIQWRKLSFRVKKMAALGDTRVVISEQMLKFHENDRREEFREQLKNKK